MNPLSASKDQREHWLEEYAQAVDFYKKAVLALKEVDGTAASGALDNLLAQADAAKEALNQCRNRYCRYRTASGGAES